LILAILLLGIFKLEEDLDSIVWWSGNCAYVKSDDDDT
jgi:hypothetical protein